jgi:DNA repair protein RecO (recombination protein O)
MISGLGRKGLKSAIAQPLTRISFATRENPKANLNSMSNPELVNLSNVNSNPLKSAISIFLSETLSKAIGEESADVELFDYLDHSLDYFEHSGSFMNFHLVLLIRLARILGFGVNSNYSAQVCLFDLENGLFVSDANNSLHMLNEKRSMAIAKIIDVKDFGADLKLGNQARRELLEDIMIYYSLHIEGLGKVKSLSVLQEIFS